MDRSLANTYAKVMIEELTNVLILTSMGRAAENDGYYKTAAGWLPRLDSNLKRLHELLESDA